MKINFENEMVTNVSVFGLAESMVRGGYPMQISTEHFLNDVIELKELLELDNNALKENKHYKRTKVLGNAKSGSGHNNVLKGITVQFDLTYTHVLTPQLQRYHFIDFVSSQSKMHRITKMNLDVACSKYTDQRVIEIAKELRDEYVSLAETKDERAQEAMWRLYDSLPMGLQLTAGMTTNYLQLQTMYNQRKNHKYYQWAGFCDFCDALPLFKELTGCTRVKGE
ncbi:MAG: hypothetical protein ACRC1D_00620 [Culicoidibacterales bacterium]